MHSGRLAVFDANNCIGHHTQGKNGGGKLHRHVRPNLGERTTVGSILEIKLPRAILRKCTSGKTSDGFSHDANIVGRSAIIWATSDNGDVEAAFYGVIVRASRRSQRAFALKVVREAAETELSSRE